MGSGSSATAVPMVAVWHGSVLHCETANHPRSYYGHKGGRDVSNTYSAVHQALPFWSSRPKAKPAAKPKAMNSDVINLAFGEVAPHCSGVTSTNPFGLRRLCGTRVEIVAALGPVEDQGQVYLGEWLALVSTQAWAARCTSAYGPTRPMA